jgi:RNA polymerase sigma factor (sigma-70 family)
MNETDLELLSRYIQQGAEDAFAEIVQRHLEVVYTAALRQVHSPQLAEEVAQSTFMKLVREARKLRHKTILVAWLYQVTRREAIDVVRREARRQLREQIATEINSVNATTTTADWKDIELLLDEAMDALSEDDRAAILLRYFENKSLRVVGETLGASEDAACKRVNRALQRLRDFFAERGVTVGATGLIALLSTNAAVAAPVGLLVTITTTAALSGVAMPSTIIGLTKTLTMTTTQKILIGAVLTTAVGTGIYEVHKASDLAAQVQALEEQQAPLAEQAHLLQQERDDALAKLEASRQEVAFFRRQTAELPKLRGEVSRLHNDSKELDQLKKNLLQDPRESQAKSWLDRVNKLEQALAQMPEQNIPELQFLKGEDWLNAVKNADRLETPDDVSRALSALRNSGKRDFALLTQQALREYGQKNNGSLPTDLSQLKPYFNPPVDDAVLQRYELTSGGAVNEKPSPIGDEDDTYYQINADSISATAGSVAERTLTEAVQRFAAANNGLKPSEPSQLWPYVTTPAEQTTLQKVIQNDPRRRR